MSEQKPFQSAFKRVHVTDFGGQQIKELQEDFDKFWRKINRLADKSHEKFYAMKAMQEACMWMSRAVALKNATISKPIIDDPLCPTNELEAKLAIDKLKTFASLKEGQVISNHPRIVVKAKKP